MSYFGVLLIILFTTILVGSGIFGMKKMLGLVLISMAGYFLGGDFSKNMLNKGVSFYVVKVAELEVKVSGETSEIADTAQNEMKNSVLDQLDGMNIPGVNLDAIELMNSPENAEKLNAFKRFQSTQLGL
jgi:hypothetical protein